MSGSDAGLHGLLHHATRPPDKVAAGPSGHCPVLMGERLPPPAEVSDGDLLGDPQAYEVAAL